MGNNIYLGGGTATHEAAPLGPQRHFVRAAAQRLWPIMDPVYGYKSVNVEAQSRSLSSLLGATKRLIYGGRESTLHLRPCRRRGVSCAVLMLHRQYQRRGDPLRRQSVAGAAQATEQLSPWKDRVRGFSHVFAANRQSSWSRWGPMASTGSKLTERDRVRPGRSRRPPEFETLAVGVELDLGVRLGARSAGVFEREESRGIPVAARIDGSN